MGTNYYLHKPSRNVCQHCGRSEEPEILHIGKSSGGWCFALNIIPEDDIHDLEDWLPVWEEGTIKNEYGDVLSSEEMFFTITKRSWHKKSDSFDWTANHAVPGPANLARHALGYGCVKHGEGTWDCIIGEFS